jgi:hypothetical protein
MKQSLFNLGVPAVTMICLLDTPPLALEWKRGMVVHVGKTEAYCVAHADGMTLHNTMQITKAGYSQAVNGDVEQVASSWTREMDYTWLNHTTNANSLLLAVAKCLEACPSDVRKQVAENIVFVGETVLIVPQLPLKLCKRLQVLLQEEGQAPELEQPETSPSALGDDLTLFPMDWSKLKALVPQAMSTGPYRSDQVAWIGASLWATVWNRHDDDNVHIQWMHAPKEEPLVGS